MRQKKLGEIKARDSQGKRYTIEHWQFWDGDEEPSPLSLQSLRLPDADRGPENPQNREEIQGFAVLVE